MKVLYNNNLNVCVLDEENNTKSFHTLKWDLSSQTFYFVYNSITYTLNLDQNTGDISWI